MNSWLDRNLSTTRQNSSKSPHRGFGTPLLSSQNDRKRLGYGLVDTPSMKITRWSKSMSGISKIKPSLTKSIFADRSFLRSSVFDRPCTVKIVPPKKSLLNYSLDAAKPPQESTLRKNLSSPNSSAINEVISSLKTFDSKNSSKRTCAELNEIFDISSGSVKKKRKTDPNTTETHVREPTAGNTTISEQTSVISNKSFWRDAALLASLSTSRQWLTEEMNRTISAAYDSDFLGVDANGTTPSRCTTPDSVQGSELSNSSTFQKSAQSNSLVGVDSRPSSLANYAINQGSNGGLSHSASASSFVTAPYNFQPVKIVLREVSTNTESDWNGNSISLNKQFSQRDIERDREMEDQRVRRLMGLEEETAVSVASSVAYSTSTSTEMKPSLPIERTGAFSVAPSALPTIASVAPVISLPKTNTVDNSANALVSKPGPSIMSSVTGKLTASAPKEASSSPKKLDFSFGSTSTPVVASQNAAGSTSNSESTVVQTSSTAPSLFSGINFNSSVVPPKVSTPTFNLGIKPSESVQPAQLASTNTTIAAASGTLSFSFGQQSTTSATSSTGPSMPSFSFAAPKSDQSSASKASAAPFSFSSVAASTTQKLGETTTTSSGAAGISSFKFSPAKSINFSSSATNASGIFSLAAKPEAPQSSTVSSITPVLTSSSTASVGSSLFGGGSFAPSDGGSMFGQTAKPESLTTSTAPSLFGSISSSQPGTSSLFGSLGSTTSAPFTSSTAAKTTPSGIFNISAPTSKNTSLPAVPVFGSSTSASTQPATTGNLFGSGSNSFVASSQPSAQSSSGMFKFGSQNASSTSAPSTFKFGSSNTDAQSSGIVSNPVFGSNIFQSSSQSSQPASLSTPFGGPSSSSTPVSNLFGAPSTKASSSNESSNIFGSASNSAAGPFGSQPQPQNIFGAGTKPSAPVFGNNSSNPSMGVTFPNSSSTNSGSLFGSGSNPIASQPVFGQSTGQGISSGSSASTAPSFVFGQNANSSTAAPSFNFGNSSNGVTFGANPASNLGSAQQQSGLPTTNSAPGAFSVGAGADSSLPNRRIRTATRKSKPTARR